MTKYIISIAGWLATAYAIACQPGCAPDVDGFVLEHATTEQTAAVQSAVDLWCAVGLCVHLGDGESSIDFAGYVRPGSDAGHKAMSDGSARIAVRPTVQGARLVNAIAHELGHHFGCDESADTASLMSWINSEAPRALSDADVACAGGARRVE